MRVFSAVRCLCLTLLGPGMAACLRGQPGHVGRRRTAANPACYKCVAGRQSGTATLVSGGVPAACSDGLVTVQIQPSALDHGA